MFPDSGKVTGVEREVEKGSEVGKGFGTKVFEVEVGKVIGAKGRRVFGGLDGVGGLGRGNGGEGGVEGKLMDLAIDLTGKGVLFVGNGGRVLFVKILGYGRGFS